MQPTQVNKIKIYLFKSKAELIDYVSDEHKILVATNTKKILKDDL